MSAHESVARDSNGKVFLKARSAYSAKYLTLSVPETATVDEAVELVRNEVWKDPGSREIAEQIGRERSAKVYTLLARRPQGDMVVVSPKTPVKEIVMPVEIQTPTGHRTVPGAAIEIQSYAPVGLRRRGSRRRRCRTLMFIH